MSDQKQLLNKIVENRLTVRKTDEEISKLLNGTNSVDSEESYSENVLAPSEELDDNQIENPFKIMPIVSDKVPTFDSTNVIGKDSFMEEPIIIIDDPEQLPAINEDQVSVNPTEEFNPFNLNDVENNIVADSNQNNIPSNPIEDIQPVTLENSNIQDDNILNSTDVNPGFMDIDKIAEDAKDIPAVIEKEPVDINSLLKPSVIGQQEPIVQEVPEEKNEEELKIGKFFSLPIDEDKDIENNALATEKNVATGITEVFNFDLDTNNEPKEVETLTSEIQAQQEAPSSQVTQNVETLPSVFDEVPVLGINELNNSLEPSKIENSPITPVDTPILEETIIPENVGENLPTEPVAPEIAAEDFTNNLITPDFDFNISSPVEREELVVNEPASSEDMPVPTMSVSAAPNKNISNAIELIRNSSKQLEQMGYVVDTEEFDFETAYQIIIKIEK
jgi:hypothetical protein